MGGGISCPKYLVLVRECTGLIASLMRWGRSVEFAIFLFLKLYVPLYRGLAQQGSV